jgi:preprotein translocase subunit SecA
LASADPETLVSFKKTSLLQIIDRVWREHLTELDYVKKGIHLRGYAQKDPKQEFKREAFNMFKNILPTIEEDFTELMMKVQIQAAFEMNVHNQNLQKQLEEFSESEKNS